MRTLLVASSLLATACTDPVEPIGDPPAPPPPSDEEQPPDDPDAPSLAAIPHFVPVPLVRQDTEYTCGVAALQSVLHYHGIDALHEGELAALLGTDPDSGTRYRAMAAYARTVGLEATIATDMTIAELAGHIDRGAPVILALQAWADGPIDWSDTWDHGHYVVAAGHDPHNIYFMDPYMRGSYTFIPRAQLDERWHDVDVDGPLEHFGLILDGKPPAYDPDRVLPMP
jgi:predicted double-glycine peptidase